MYCAYSKQALSINQHVYTVNMYCLLFNMYFVYSQLAMPINQHVLYIQSTGTVY